MVNAITPMRLISCMWYSSARIFFGRGAVMAKALGATPEEEQKLGLHKLATVRFLGCNLIIRLNDYDITANKRPSRPILHRFTTG